MFSLHDRLMGYFEESRLRELTGRRSVWNDLVKDKNKKTEHLSIKMTKTTELWFIISDVLLWVTVV